jgi:hypothetical protein
VCVPVCRTETNDFVFGSIMDMAVPPPLQWEVDDQLEVFCVLPNGEERYSIVTRVNHTKNYIFILCYVILFYFILFIYRWDPAVVWSVSQGHRYNVYNQSTSQVRISLRGVFWAHFSLISFYFDLRYKKGFTRLSSPSSPRRSVF